MMSSAIKKLEEGEELQLQFAKRGGLLPVAVQDFKTGTILMLGSINKQAFEKTLELGKATFWSTSRNELWTKGETSGNYLLLKEILVDCDQDAVVYKVDSIGDGACHTFNEKGQHREGCFYRKLDFECGTLIKLEI